MLDLTLGRCCGGGVVWGVEDMLEASQLRNLYHEGLFGTSNVTKWKSGEPAEVYWNSGAKHRGGYAYRLCKVNNGKYRLRYVTEESFQKGHPKFHCKIEKFVMENQQPIFLIWVGQDWSSSPSTTRWRLGIQGPGGGS